MTCQGRLDYTRAENLFRQLGELETEIFQRRLEEMQEFQDRVHRGKGGMRVYDA